MRGRTTISIPYRLKKKYNNIKSELEDIEGRDIPDPEFLEQLLDFYVEHKSCFMDRKIRHLIDYLAKIEKERDDEILQLRQRIVKLENENSELRRKVSEETLNDFELLRRWVVSVTDIVHHSDFSNKDKDFISNTLVMLIYYLYGSIKQPKLDLKKLYRFAKKIENIKNED